jgi:hypothetical protein
MNSNSVLRPWRHVFVSHTANMAHYPRPVPFVQGVFAVANLAGLLVQDGSAPSGL